MCGSGSDRQGFKVGKRDRDRDLETEREREGERERERERESKRVRNNKCGLRNRRRPQVGLGTRRTFINVLLRGLR